MQSTQEICSEIVSMAGALRAQILQQYPECKIFDENCPGESHLESIDEKTYATGQKRVIQARKGPVHNVVCAQALINILTATERHLPFAESFLSWSNSGVMATGLFLMSTVLNLFDNSIQNIRKDITPISNSFCYLFNPSIDLGDIDRAKYGILFQDFILSCLDKTKDIFADDGIYEQIIFRLGLIKNPDITEYRKARNEIVGKTREYIPSILRTSLQQMKSEALVDMFQQIKGLNNQKMCELLLDAFEKKLLTENDAIYEQRNFTLQELFILRSLAKSILKEGIDQTTNILDTLPDTLSERLSHSDILLNTLNSIPWICETAREKLEKTCNQINKALSISYFLYYQQRQQELTTITTDKGLFQFFKQPIADTQESISLGIPIQAKDIRLLHGYSIFLTCALTYLSENVPSETYSSYLHLKTYYQMLVEEPGKALEADKTYCSIFPEEDEDSDEDDVNEAHRAVPNNNK